MDELFAEIDDEEVTNFDEIFGEETPEDSQPEETSEEEPPAQEGGTEDEAQSSEEIPEEKEPPFHEHPRWKEREENWKIRMDRQEQEFNRKIEELQGKFQPAEQSPSETINPLLVPLIGDDPAAHKAWNDAQKQARIVMRQEMQQEEETRQREARENTERWENWVKDGVARLKSQGKRFDENALVKVAVDYRPTDDQGNISIDKAYDILEQLSPKDRQKAKAKKEVAAQVTSKPSGEGSITKKITSAELRNMPWY